MKIHAHTHASCHSLSKISREEGGGAPDGTGFPKKETKTSCKPHEGTLVNEHNKTQERILV